MHTYINTYLPTYLHTHIHTYLPTYICVLPDYSIQQRIAIRLKLVTARESERDSIRGCVRQSANAALAGPSI
eukprot:7730327-Heterocapsa_arctica.AAC.1